MTSRRAGPALLVLGAFVVICAGIKLAAALLVPFLLAGFVATATAPLVLFLNRRRWPRGLAVLVGLLVDLAALALLGALVAISVGALARRVPIYQERIAELSRQLTIYVVELGIGISPESIRGAIDPSWMVEVLGGLLQEVASVVSRLVLVLLIVAFMLFEVTGLPMKVREVFASQSGVDRLRRAATEVNKYVQVKTATSLATGVLITLWCVAWDLDLPILWGLLAFLLNYIPTIGSIVAAIPAVALALLQHDLGTAAAVLFGYVVINFSIGNLIDPRLMGDALGLSPLVVFLSMIFWGWLLGPIGALLSAPLTMIVKMLFAASADLAWVAALLGPVPRIAKEKVPSPG